ncbi:MAG: ABC transporter permease [Thermoanaerobaculaceae bacterium]
MYRILSELSDAVRRLLRRPAHTLALTGVLAVGLALAITMFEGLNGYVLRPLPVREPERVMLVTMSIPAQGLEGGSFALHDLVDWRERQHSFELLAGFGQGTFNLGGIERPERLAGAVVTDGFFEMFGVAPRLGRWVRASDCAPGAPPVLVLGHTVWERSFAADPAVLGRTVRLNGQTAEVIGVMPPSFRLPLDEDAWTALPLDTGATSRSEGRAVGVIGRLADGASRGQAQAELSTIAEELGRAYPETNAGRVPVVAPYAEEWVGAQTRATVSALFICTLLVLLVACANVANLIVARLAAGSREMSVRSALGASTGRLIRPILAECLVVSVAATVIGSALSRAGMVWITATLQRTDASRPSWVQFDPDWRSAVFAVAAALACTFIPGLLPAWRLVRRDPVEGLRAGGRGAVGGRLGRMSRGLVAVEVGLACVVLICAGLMVRSALKVGRVGLGVRTEGVLTGRVGLFAADYPTEAACAQLFTGLLQRLEAMPGATAVAASTSLPGAGSGFCSYLGEGESLEPGKQPPFARFVGVSPGYFGVLEVPLLAGRLVGESDTADAPPVAVVNAVLAERLGGTQAVLGRRLQLSAGDRTELHTVVGVVGNVQQGSISNRMSSTVYVPLVQTPPRFASLLVRTAGEPRAHAETLRSVVRQADPNLPVYWLQPLADWPSQRIVLQRFLATMFGVFAGAGLLLAATGLFAVLAQVVGGRTAEIGLRRALGASASGIVAMISRQNAWPVGIGLVTGLGLGVGLAHLIAGELVGVRPTDPLAIGLGTLALIGCAALAAWTPARRAVRIEPATALRTE